MNRRILIHLILLSLTASLPGNYLYSQKINRKVLRFIKKEVNFDVAIAGALKSRGDSFYQYPKMLVIINKPDTGKIIRRLGRQKLIAELKNCLNYPEYDWNANLHLYALTGKRAAIFAVIKTRQEWVEEYREKDIAYWKEYTGTEPEQ